METPASRRTRGARRIGFAYALLAFTFAGPSAAVEGRGADALETSREVDERGMSVLRSTRRRSPSGFLYPYPFRPRSYSEWGEYELRGFLELGFLGDAGDDDEAQFRKYTDWSEGALLRDFELDLRQKAGLGYLSLEGGAVGRDDQFYRGELGQFGRFRLTGFFDSLSHRYADDARFLLEDVGTDTLTLPAPLVPGGNTLGAIDAELAGVQPRRVERQRDDAGVDLSVRALPDLRIFANYRNQRHEGLRPFAGTLGFTLNTTSAGSVIETLEPLDSRTHDWSVGLEYAGSPVQANLYYRGSVYESDFDSLTWENPFFASSAPPSPFPGQPRGRAALSPDNHSHHIAGDVGAQLPWHGRFTASGSWTRFRQDARLLAPTINTSLTDWNDASTALPRARADAQVDQWVARGSIRLKPLRSLSVQLTGRYFERDSDTRYRADNTTAGFAGYVVEDLGPTGRVGAAGFSYKRWSVEGKASLRLDSKTRAGLEYEHEETIRENRARREVRDERVRLNLTTRALPHTNLRVSYEFLHRGGSDFDPTRDQDLYGDPRFPGLPRGPSRGLVDFAQFDLVSRDQHQVDLRTNWQIGEVADVSLTGRFREGDPNTSYGLTRDRTAGLDLDASYQPSPEIDLRAFGSLEWRDRRLASINASLPGAASGDFTAGGPTYPFTNEWSLDSELWSFALGVGTRYRPVERLELRLDYTHLRSREELKYAYASTAALPPAVDTTSLPDRFQSLHFQDHVFDAQASYQWTEWLETTLFYRLQYSTIEDFQQEDLEARINQNLFLAHVDGDFTAHVFGALVALRF